MTYDATTDFVFMTDKVQIMLLVKHMKFIHLFAEIRDFMNNSVRHDYADISFFLNMKPDHLAQCGFQCITFINWGMRHSWSTHCATGQNVTHLIPDDATAIFTDNLSSHPVALGSIEPLTEMSTRA